MKLISISTFFSTKLKLKSKLKKNRCNNFPSVRSTATTSSSSDPTTSKSVLRLHDLFGVFDRDGDDKITKRDLEIVLRRLSTKPPTEEELASMVSEIDRDGDGCISLEELGPPACGGELRDAFAVFDADGDGKISAEELLGVFLTLGDGGCTLEDCHRMIGGVDSDGDGFVCFEDFARMMGRTEMVAEEKQGWCWVLRCSGKGLRSTPRPPVLVLPARPRSYANCPKKVGMSIRVDESHLGLI